MRVNVQVNKIIGYFHIQKAEKVHQWKNVEVNRELFLINNLASCQSMHKPSITGKYWPPPESHWVCEVPAEPAGSQDTPGWISHRFKCQPPLAERVFEGWVLYNHKLRLKSQFELSLIIVFDI